MNFNLQFEFHPLLILPALLISLGTAYFLYARDSRFDKKAKNVLFILRSFCVFMILILLLNPILKHFENKIEPASYAIAIDNSASIQNALGEEGILNLKNKITSTIDYLSSNDIRPVVFDLKGKIKENELDSLKFNEKTTDLSLLLRHVRSSFENRNLSGILLISDGLYNRGASPLFLNAGTRLSSLGVGDTSQIKDIWINSVRYNDIVFLDNKFPINIKIQKEGIGFCEVSLLLKKGDKVIEQAKLSLNNGENLKEFEFEAIAREKGQQVYTVELKLLNEEDEIELNNSQKIYLEVIEGKDKILILAKNPHPDIKAIKSALDESDNYEITTYYPKDSNLPSDKFDLVIMHQIPNLENIGNGFVEKYINEKTPIWFILGPSSNLFFLNRQFNGVRVLSQVSQMDEVNALLNPNFKKFTLPENSSDLLSSFPPIKVPFAKYEMGEGTEIVLFQSVSGINTEKPLLALQQNTENKFAFMAGDGLWRWRMYEYAKNENFEFTNALINKVVQLLSLKEDKRKFRMKVKDYRDIYEGGNVTFETEVYNDIYELIYGNKVNMKVKGNDRTIEYDFIHSENSDFKISGLEPGIYTYVAETKLDDSEYKIEGEFTVKKLQLEALKTQADFELLKNTSENNSGVFLSDLTEEDI